MASPHPANEQHLGAWAVCPTINHDDKAVITEPILFKSEDEALEWLRAPSIFVHDKLDDDAERQSLGLPKQTREQWLGMIAAGWSERDERPPRPSRTLEMPSDLGDRVFVCSCLKLVRSSIVNVVSLPIQVHEAENDRGPLRTFGLAEFRPIANIDETPVADTHESIGRALQDQVDPWMTCLGEGWDFASIIKEAGHRHSFEGAHIESVRKTLWGALIGIEEHLLKRHRNLSSAALTSFWMSWQVRRWLHCFSERIDQHASRSSLLKQRLEPCSDALDFVEWQLRVYVQTIGSDVCAPSAAGTFEGTAEGSLHEHGAASKANTTDRQRKKTELTDEQAEAAEAAVTNKMEVSIQMAAWFLRCQTKHIKRLAGEHELDTGVKPKTITSTSLLAYRVRGSARKLTPEQRSELSKKAARARWQKSDVSS